MRVINSNIYRSVFLIFGLAACDPNSLENASAATRSDQTTLFSSALNADCDIKPNSTLIDSRGIYSLFRDGPRTGKDDQPTYYVTANNICIYEFIHQHYYEDTGEKIFDNPVMLKISDFSFPHPGYVLILGLNVEKFTAEPVVRELMTPIVEKFLLENGFQADDSLRSDQLQAKFSKFESDYIITLSYELPLPVGTAEALYLVDGIPFIRRDR